MDNQKPLVDSEYLLQKFLGKGGWTYALIPEIPQSKVNPFGWVIIKGNIDGFELKQYKLMPMGNGKLFLPVRAEIRKKINKSAGDFVSITLYPDGSPVEIPTEIIECFKMEPKKNYETFITFTEGEQKAYIDWIYSAKTDETKANRILIMMDRIQRKLKFYDKED